MQQIKQISAAIFVLVAALLTAVPAVGQRIVTLNLPSDLCGGTQMPLSIGYRPSSTVVIDAPRSTLRHSERIFLPDGISCGEHGCAYQSRVTFTDFDSAARVTSVEDILYVRLNIEHTYLGDLYINITCPDNKKADLMKKSASGSSDCSSNIPNTSVGWTAGDNTDEETFLGDALDLESDNEEDLCDSLAAGNGPGTGWNYCWSNNTSAGYRYAPGDGIIYRRANAHQHRNTFFGYTFLTIDSSDATTGNNFYHPDESFAQLTGCPLNGDWYIEVMDGYSMDNGYIFEWELSLDPALLPEPCVVIGQEIIGSYVSRTNDSTYLLHLPNDVGYDTTLKYTFRLFTSCGDTIDSNTTLRLHPTYTFESDTMDCNTFTWRGETYTTSTTLVEQCTSIHQCDSVNILNINVISDKLKARISASPLIVTPMNPRVELRDISNYSIGGLWLLPQYSSTERYIAYDVPTEVDSLQVLLVAYSQEGCSDTARVCVLMDHSELWSPNAFTPDLESNNRWRVVTHDLASVEIWIYNRQGILVGHFDTLDGYWDGTCNGTPCPQGNYAYRMRYSTRVRPKQNHETTGSILLIR